MVKIGKKYEVSDNAIRQWLKKYKEELKDLDIDIDREKIPSGAPLI